MASSTVTYEAPRQQPIKEVALTLSEQEAILILGVLYQVTYDTARSSAGRAPCQRKYNTPSQVQEQIRSINEALRTVLT